MDILYLSSLCSKKEYERMFSTYGSTSSHASQKFNRLLIKGLVENGCSVEALTERIIVNCDENDLKSFDEIEDGIKYVYLPRYANRKKNRIMTIFNAVRYMVNWKKKHTNGVVICDIILGELSLAVWFLSMFIKIKTTAIVTDVPSIRAGEKRRGIKSIPFKIKNLVISSYKSYIFLTEQMNKKLNPKNKPYVVIEGIVDDGVLLKPNTLEAKHHEKVIMMAGLLEEIFGVDTLLSAFMKVDCSEARLKFYGKGSSVTQIINISKKDPRISYVGELANDQIVEEEKKATLLINPRPPIGKWTAYSFPSKNMEYIASGTPLVAFDLPCIPEEYKPYFYHLSQYSEEGICCILQGLLKLDNSSLHDFGIKAQEWITKTKTAKLQLKSYVDLLNNIL